LRGVTLAQKRLELMDICNAGTADFQIQPLTKSTACTL
jgi:hypothetical protein